MEEVGPMTRHSAAGKLPAIAIVDAAREPYGVVVADSPEYLWAAIHDALRRRREGARARPPAHAAPADFAAAMRRVEEEVYDAG
jgi:hypothetical protein